MTERQFVLRVGATGEGAHPDFVEHAGIEYFGPFNEENGQAIEKAILERWTEIPAEQFVYGKLVVELIPIRGVAIDLAAEPGLPLAIADNWYYDAEAQA